ncbi:MAG: PTS sugar transporter subunit IIB [Desulfovibrionaceae bacterium]|nr:PTS sugar transporter subunit IIB [Desulfovibrionaceae bacterium]
MVWVRIDNRLVHGQIIESWLPYLGASVIVVANDDLSTDAIRQEIMSLAIPNSVTSVFVGVEELISRQAEDWSRPSPQEALVLFSCCLDARRAFETGFSFKVLNVGNIHYQAGSRQLSPNVALSREDEICLRYFLNRDVSLDFRCVPNDAVQVRL